MKVLAICGSPRKGNTEWMLRELLEGLDSAEVDTELVLLRKLNIKGCDGCLACEAGGENREGTCRIEDDMPQLYAKLLDADCVVFGTPVYFEMVSGQLKTFMDRTCPVWTKLSGKSIAGIVVAEGGIGQAVRNLRTYGKVCDMRWVGAVTALAKTPKEVAKNPRIEGRLRILARKITGALNAA